MIKRFSVLSPDQEGMDARIVWAAAQASKGVMTTVEGNGGFTVVSLTGMQLSTFVRQLMDKTDSHGGGRTSPDVLAILRDLDRVGCQAGYVLDSSGSITYISTTTPAQFDRFQRALTPILTRHSELEELRLHLSTVLNELG